MFPTNIRQKDNERLFVAVFACNGSVTVWERMQTPFFNEMDHITEFWHDSYHLKSTFRSALYDTSVVELVKSASPWGYHSLVSEDAHVDLWSIDHSRPKLSSRYFPPTGTEFSTYSIRYEATREIEVYVVKVFMPLLLVLLMSQTSFWIPTTFIRGRFFVAFSVLGSVATFGFTIRRTIPQVAETTQFDKFIVWSYTLLVLSMIESIVVFELKKKAKWTTRWFKLLPLGRHSKLRTSSNRSSAPTISSSLEADVGSRHQSLLTGDSSDHTLNDAAASASSSEVFDTSMVETEIEGEALMVAQFLDMLFRVLYPVLIILGIVIFLV